MTPPQTFSLRLRDPPEPLQRRADRDHRRRPALGLHDERSLLDRQVAAAVVVEDVDASQDVRRGPMEVRERAVRVGPRRAGDDELLGAERAVFGA